MKTLSLQNEKCPFLLNSWRRTANLQELEIKELKPKRKFVPGKKQKSKYEQLRESEWDHAFDEGCRDRMIMGAFRYGRLADRDKPTYDLTKALLSKFYLFIKTGNGEFLMDVANYARLAYYYKQHKNFHFAPTDDVCHAKVLKEPLIKRIFLWARKKLSL